MGRDVGHSRGRRVGRAAAAALAVIGVLQGPIVSAGGATGGADTARSQQVIRGRNIVLLDGCNDCHTAGYARSGSKVPESRWLSGGDPGGLRGPWGDIRPPDLRAKVARLSESQWIRLARSLKKRPPMPQHNLGDMSDEALKAVYWFIKSLGPERRAP